ncbi:DNA polymerase IV [bacterium]|nr:DNA polymerase IV [bacterium]
MDAFYASIEQRDNPVIRNRPVVVGADPAGGSGRGVVSAASYEARTFGIHSAMPISTAYKRCPHAVFLPVDTEKYCRVSSGIMALFHEYAPVVEAVSLDEAFLDVSGVQRLFSGAERIARTIKERILSEHRLTASVGIAPNKLLAKMASEFDKPDGFTVVPQERVQQFLDPLPVSALWGVGKKTDVRLAAMGVRTVRQLRAVPQQDLESIFGKNGGSLWNYARGLDDSPVEAGRQAKSISNEHTFARDETCPEVIADTILQLSEKVGFRLRNRRLTAKTITFKLRFEDFQTLVRAKTVDHPVSLSEDIYAAAVGIYGELNRERRPVRLIGVGVSHLGESGGGQMSFFSEERETREQLSLTIDEIKKRFGENAIRRGPRY